MLNTSETSRPLYSEQEEKFILYISKNLINKLMDELKSLSDVNYNDMKFKLAYHAIMSDKNECLEVILKSLKGIIPDASQKVNDLIKSAQNLNANKCLSTLNQFDYQNLGSVAAFWWKFLFYSVDQRKEFIKNEPLKFSCVKDRTDRLNLEQKRNEDTPPVQNTM